MAFALLLPTTYLTIVAWSYARKEGVLGARFSGGVPRLLVAVAILVILALAMRFRPASQVVRGLRETVPFLACLLIYTNLHDTIGFVNPHDVHWWLVAFDKTIFGVVPCVWAERFIQPRLTDLMQFFYLSFFWIAPSTSLALLVRRKWAEFRKATLGVLVCFYIGYVLYVVFPAAPPRLVLVFEFTKNLRGYSEVISTLSAGAFALLPTDSRAAFPSLHTAVSTVSLIYAWRYARTFFYVLVPFVLGLWASTIYLRHHYFVDLVAGWLLAPLAVWVAPHLEAFWARHQVSAGATDTAGG